MGQPSHGPQRGQLMIREELLGYHNNNNNNGHTMVSDHDSNDGYKNDNQGNDGHRP